MSSKSKRQQTLAKRAREQKVREKRTLKQERKAAAREAKLNGEGGEILSTEEHETLDEPEDGRES